MRALKFFLVNAILLVVLVHLLGHGIARHFYRNLKDRFLHGNTGQVVHFEKLFKPIHKNCIVYPQFLSR